jgi:hypothetical protein
MHLFWTVEEERSVFRQVDRFAVDQSAKQTISELEIEAIKERECETIIN